jgi:hypothetical protein
MRLAQCFARLQTPQARVRTTARDELFMRARLDDAAGVEHVDAVGKDSSHFTRPGLGQRRRSRLGTNAARRRFRTGELATGLFASTFHYVHVVKLQPASGAPDGQECRPVSQANP